MNIQCFVSCWGNEVAITGALHLAHEWKAQGIEGATPTEESQREALRTRTLPWIAEIATGNGYVPTPHLSPEQHYDDLKQKLEAAMVFDPLLVTTLAGSDAWSLAEAVSFYERALGLETEFGVPIAFETHRSRPTFHPWATRELLKALPTLQLTCDFSHWCAVTERLVLNEERELLQLIAMRTRHIHARVGYAQGPQVPDPRAPEYRTEVEAHLNWWKKIALEQQSLGKACLTFTPEFGPDGYLQQEPYSQRRVASLHQVNRWMMDKLRDVMNLS